MTATARYEVCYYRLGKLVHAVPAKSRSAAELLALDGLRDHCEVSIYRDGRALRDWFMRTAH